MQDRDNKTIASGRFRNTIFLIAKFLVSSLCVWFVFEQLKQKSGPFELALLTGMHYTAIALVLLLMVVNWLLEAIRWKWSLAPFAKLDTKEALGEVLRGLALNWVLPFTGGDFVSRMAKRERKAETVAAILFNRSILLALTLFFGLYSLWVYNQMSFSRMIMTAFLVALFCFMVYHVVVSQFRTVKGYFHLLGRQLSMKVIFISVTRYLVFTLQFFLLLKVFLPSVSASFLFAGVGWIFFIRSVIPSLLGGIGLREASACLFFEGIVHDTALVLSPVFLIWVINTVLPSLVGAALIWKLKVNIAG